MRADILTGAWLEHAELARSLWDEGLLASEIARRVGHGATKNSIVGFAHRHAWPPRPSPIAVNGQRPDAAVPRVAYKPKAARKPKALAKPPKAPRKPPAATPVPTRPAPPPEPTHSWGCQWISSEPDKRPRRWCGAPVSAPGSAWCLHHRSIVYVTRRTPVSA